MDKLSVDDTIREAILFSTNRSEQYDEIASRLELTRQQAKMLFFAWIYRATEESLQGRLAEFVAINKRTVV